MVRGSGLADGFLDALRTPAFLSAHEALLRSGTWVRREEFDALGHLPIPTENALADLVMLGWAHYQPGVGYRLAKPALARAAARDLMAAPEDQRCVKAVQRDHGLEVGVAVRYGPGATDVAATVVAVDAPEGVDGPDVAQWAVGCMVQGMDAGGAAC
jgi:hypothetical protein